jgi:tetratricopeptide (TPR) repeat protein
MKRILPLLFITLLTTFASRAASPVSSAPPTGTATSLVIVSRASDAGSKFLAAEYARSLIHLFGDVDRLAVIPRARVLKAEASDEKPADIGRALSATHVLMAVVQATDETFVFSAELVETRSNRKLWHEKIRANLAEGAGLPAKVALAVTHALGRPSPTRNDRGKSITTSNPAAWRAYLGGRRALDTLTEPSLVEAIAHFERALAVDPTFTAARSGLATAHIALGYNFRIPRTHFIKARETLAQVTAANGSLPEAATADAVLKFYHERDWHAAARGARFVTLNDPSAVETHACFLHCAQTLGRIEEGRREIASAHHAQPGSMAIRSELTCATYYAGNFPEAEREARAALKSDPENPLLHWSLARSLAQQGKFAPALAELKSAQAKPGGEWAGILSEIAYLHGRQNRRTEAAQVIAQLHDREKTEYVDPYLYAMAYAGLGESAEVCRQLEQALANDSTWISSVALEPKFAALKKEPRFQALLRALNSPVE